MRGIKRLVNKAPEHDVQVGNTDDGCFVDIQQGVNRVRLEPPMEQALDIAAGMVVACIPTALRSGLTVEQYLDEVTDRLSARMNEALGQVQTNGEPS